VQTHPGYAESSRIVWVRKPKTLRLIQDSYKDCPLCVSTQIQIFSASPNPPLFKKPSSAAGYPAWHITSTQKPVKPGCRI